MVWVIKNKLGEYWRDYTWDAKPVAMHFRSIAAAHASLAKWTSNEAFESNKPRIVRLKPRAARSEADIRRAERERIAAAMTVTSKSPDAVWLGDRAIVVGAAHPEQWAMQCRQAILDLEWNP